jgi:hypothetical protein
MYSYKIGSFFSSSSIFSPVLFLSPYLRIYTPHVEKYLHNTRRQERKREREKMKMAMYRWQVTHASPQPYFASRFHCCDDNNNDDNNNNNKIAEAEQKKKTALIHKRKRKNRR